MAERRIINHATRIQFPRGVRLRRDETRNAWVLMSPERVSVLNQTAYEVLSRVDGQRSVGEIVQNLCETFDAPSEAIAADVIETLQSLSDDGLVIGND